MPPRPDTRSFRGGSFASPRRPPRGADVDRPASLAKAVTAQAVLAGLPPIFEPHASDVRGSVVDVMRRSGLVDLLSKDQFYLTVRRAVERAEALAQSDRPTVKDEQHQTEQPSVSESRAIGRPLHQGEQP